MTTTTLRLLRALLLIGLVSLQGAQSLRCFVCDTTSAQSYADANDQCNIHNQEECADPRATACMLEGYMKPNNVAQVVKKCVLKCPVFINTTAEVVRCCPKDGCNGELNHRPPPHMDMRGRFPPYGAGPTTMDRDEGGMGRDMGRDGGPGGMGPGGMGPGMRPDQHPPRPEAGGGGNPNMPPRIPDMPDPEAPMMPEDNAVDSDPTDRQMKRPRNKGMEKAPRGGEIRKKNGGSVSRSGTTDEQMGDSSAAATLTTFTIPSCVCIVSSYVVSTMRW